MLKLSNPQSKPLSQREPRNRRCAGGRPKEIRDIKELAREHTAAALNALTEIVQNPKASPSARVAAANSLLDRGYGRAESTSNVRIEKPVYDMNLLPPELRAKLQKVLDEHGPLIEQANEFVRRHAEAKADGSMN